MAADAMGRWVRLWVVGWVGRLGGLGLQKSNLNLIRAVHIFA